ncbi:MULTISPECIES: hypothetical protein [unclassified Duganella]|uniref:hypothetical protein n=1 Tax=unclassified Duganella TaxID=2636909 RepID=UPI000701A416|nr:MULTISPECIES: hypothetical protein [unclassified Duganella]KQV59083.1 hypothetical protein ASD07_25975 [Duganella sp. Root336D2]KRB93394.1 hypothetical protein ASE26_28010 [Duganella sp. Root198D2]
MKNDWTVLPSTEADIDAVRERCRRLVRRRAAVSAGVAAVPIPGIDVVSDLRLFTQLIDDVNHEFGLSPDQIDRMQPKLKLIAYEAVISLGGMLVGKVVTRELVGAVLKRSAGKIAVKQAGKLVPIAGQIASATIGFFAFRQIGYQHVEACAKVARQVIAAHAKA